VELRKARKTDLRFIVELESRPELSPFINSWPEARHARSLDDPDFLYLIFEQNGQREGFAFLNGLQSPNRAIQLCRFALAAPGAGKGRTACRLIMREAFETVGAHRLYLDLFEDNARAEHLYRSLGFQMEGFLREAERRSDRFRSLKLMSLLEDEYRAGKDKA
jgi:diamine N-acetyltransferase